MSMDLRVNHAQLDTAANDLARTVRDLDERLNRLEGELSPLRSEWIGSAQQAYTQAKAKWDAAMANLNEVLAKTSTAVSNANQEYAAADRRGANNFQI